MNTGRLSLVIALSLACVAPRSSRRLATPDDAPRADEGGPTAPAVLPAVPAALPAAQSAVPSSSAAASQAAAPAPPPAPVQVLPFDEAVTAATEKLFAKAQPSLGAPPFALVIDPLIDGVTGEQSNATRSMGDLIATVVRAKHSEFVLEPLTRRSIARSPLVLIGTLTAVDAKGQPAGPREAYRICLALLDLRTGRIVSKAWARADTSGVDPSPLAFFRDSPAWAEDPTVEGYIKTCQSRSVGDPIDTAYLDRILVGALVNEALEAYDAGRFREALETYAEAQRMTSGADELRVLNGLYLSNYKLGRRDAALEQFDRIVDYGLSHRNLAVKFLFTPGSTGFWRDPDVSGPYPSWLRRIAERSAVADRCLEISGHTSATGPAPLNERLSQLRAETIQGKLVAISPTLASRTIAVGMGSRENVVGTGRDDASDALDRRVGFTVIECPTVAADARATP